MQEPPEPAAPEPAPAPTPRRAHPVRNFFIQLVTITAGVLIALFFEGLVEWNNNRALVREAKAMIVREIRDNRKELEGTRAQIETIRNDLETAVRLADDLLQKKSSEVRRITFQRGFAQLSSASWQTAERTGALGHMDYDDVRRYSGIYTLQALFARHQQRVLERMAGALAMLASGDPYQAAPRDLETFREHVLQMLGDLTIEQDLGGSLSKEYETELNR